MRVRILPFSTTVIIQETRIFRAIFVCGILLLVARQTNAVPPVAEDTTSPNTFWFTSDIYYVDEDATNAVVTVEFSPGDRSWSGSVNYSMSNGTAMAGEDFISGSGTLSFSGPGPARQIVIPIIRDNLGESNETVQLFLSNPNANLVRSNATLVIIDKNQTPKLQITSGANQTIMLSWPSNYTDFVLEKNSQFSGDNWCAVSSTQKVAAGFCCVTEPCSTAPAFYRLRKNSPTP